jgi:hypothetical protein
MKMKVENWLIVEKIIRIKESPVPIKFQKELEAPILWLFFGF